MTVTPKLRFVNISCHSLSTTFVTSETWTTTDKAVNLEVEAYEQHVNNQNEG